MSSDEVVQYNMPLILLNGGDLVEKNTNVNKIKNVFSFLQIGVRIIEAWDAIDR